jgi:O-antigen ligase
MDLTVAQLAQLAAALLMAIAIFVAAWITPLKTAVTILFILVPFQSIETKYGSSNVVMTYILFAGLLLSGRNLRVPMLGSILIILFCYLLSLTQVHKSVYGQHMIYIVMLVSGFLVLILMYNLAREVENTRSLVTILMVINAAVILYCLLQLAAGPGAKTVLFGIEELDMSRNRGGGDSRLSGPFGASPGLTAEYMALMTMVFAYDLMYSPRSRRILLVGLVASNLGLMVATGNRGSFLTLIAIFPFFLYMYRRTLGTKRAIQFSVLGAGLLTIMALIVVSYTDFNVMFERLAETTETENGVPATRANTWPIAWENIQLKPWLGHGPRLRLLDDELVVYKDHVVIPYPHSLYLYLLFTVGILGATAVLGFIVRIALHIYQGRNRIFESDYTQGLARLGTLLMVAFLIDQIKIEFMRINFVDYQHFVFGMFGMWLGLVDRGSTMVPSGATLPIQRWAGLADQLPNAATRTRIGTGR